jgi:hypothetical protein
MTLPDFRTLSPLQMLLGVAALAVLIGIGLAAQRRRAARDGVGLAVWLMIPLVLAVCAVGVWTLMGTLNLMGSAF